MKHSETVDSFDRFFLHQGESGLKAYEEAVQMTKDILMSEIEEHPSPYSGKRPDELEKSIEKMRLSSPSGEDIETVLTDIKEQIMRHTIRVSHPKSIAHLHCPPLIASIAAEMIISAFNQSMDSWDQSPSATYVEKEMIHWLCRQFNYPSQADGAFTSGGTQSNYTGLLLARDYFCQTRLNWDVKKKGLPPEARRMKILCSESAHFSVRKSASQLGLGEDSVIPVKIDNHFRMSMKDLDHKLDEIKKKGNLPIAIAATCGTTDFGSIDPMPLIAEAAKKHNLWLHVDAAYGGALVLSGRHRYKLNGIQEADSIAVDFHKLFYQPISCGALLLKESKHFQLMKLHADYLNPEEDVIDGMINLVEKSVQTTRRFDALKLLMALRIVGTENFARMIDYTIHLANDTVKEIERHEAFEIINKKPELNALVFRYTPGLGDTDKENQINRKIQQSLLIQGFAAIAKTSVFGKTCLKLTLLNPRTTLSDIREILREISLLGHQMTSKKEA
ncbi:L-2,4-diaminobutyrate decarboxylase [Scopulibacillus daqui]|uniref:L-2,4-diaminobutyrate decarboxylase n=1 Tax=Scopulibacillus daqui TaxID=1469162 RepID=A0ABS2PY69_9BACL|nr:aspartate aminotransferase family protein [Scopulibacillus daqui]MBM7644520.1 L-2,4-diaminobutyrate decarboxylase [Scopulibacillus daqui]